MVDAVYIALPNHLHADYSIRAARAGIHVLCEKPMAVTEKECRAMIQAAERAGIKLMIAYRLHFEEANMTAVRIVRSGKLGNPRFFTSSFSMQVRPDNIRTDKEKGGGTLYDIGIYCINAARYLFGAEPTEVFAFSSANKKDPRFKEIDEMTSALLRFPDGRLAAVLTRASARPTWPAIAWWARKATCDSTKLTSTFIPSSSMSRSRAKPGSKPFANEISLRPSWSTSPVVFLTTRLQSPRGREGIADVRVIEALYRSAKRRRAVKIEPVRQTKRPSIKQTKHRPAVDKPTACARRERGVITRVTPRFG